MHSAVKYSVDQEVLESAVELEQFFTQISVQLFCSILLFLISGD